ncbi:serine dehydratase beta chain, partial [Ralstonia solanacearum species complex bacterium RW470]|uniref:serine dehydratase beta chain n=1 Tax=Ralstonia solanacearum species complex bacterium RW470 TaxID=3119580 RepID=UPI002FC2B4E0
GSLGATGKGHGTDRGVILGLMGEAPDTIDPDTIDAKLAALRQVSSFSSISRAMDLPVDSHIASSSRPLRNGWGSWSCALRT